MKISPKRAEYVAITGLVLNGIFFGVTYVLGYWSNSFAVTAISWQILAGAMVWFVLAIQFHLRGMAEREKLDLEQLTKSDETTIFEGEGQRKELFAVAGKRLAIYEKWFLPILSCLVAAYLVAMGVVLLRQGFDASAEFVKQPLPTSVYMAAIAFVSFLISRYATGMSNEGQWKPLRAGGGYLVVTALLGLLAGGGLAAAQFKYYVFLYVLGVAVPIAMIVLGAEVALNVLLEMYSPRLDGRYRRAGFDSRIVSLINEPGSVLQTAANAIDYQFGFKVSQTWFYKLLEKAILPMILFSAVTLYSLSAIVVVNADEEAIIERFGKPIRGGEVIGPGIALKWPWPIDIAYAYPTKRIQQIHIGYELEDPAKRTREPLLWHLAHHKAEHNILVAGRATAAETERGVVPLNILMASVPVQFRVKDLHSFMYNYGTRMYNGKSLPVAVDLLEGISYRELVLYAASSNQDEAAAAEHGLSILGQNREKAANLLRERVQAQADEAGLGVEIIFLGLQGLHPPKEVARDYQEVVGAVVEKQAMVLTAMADRNSILSGLAGSVQKADELHGLIRQHQTGGIAAQELDERFATAGGDIFATLRRSRSYSYEKQAAARSTGERFQNQILAYRAAPYIYKKELRLSMLEEVSPWLRKYVILLDPEDHRVMIINLEEGVGSGLMDFSPVDAR